MNKGHVRCRGKALFRIFLKKSPHLGRPLVNVLQSSAYKFTLLQSNVRKIIILYAITPGIRTE